jgi:hypothetical protein
LNGTGILYCPRIFVNPDGIVGLKGKGEGEVSHTAKEVQDPFVSPHLGQFQDGVNEAVILLSIDLEKTERSNAVSDLDPPGGIP